MNLLLINGDQLRYDCLGHVGLRNVKTPNLDALAKNSVVYTNAYTPLPVCAPARQALLSGRNPNSFGAQWNYDVMPTPTVQPEWCWPGELSDKGMQTAHVGSFHASTNLKPYDFGYQKDVSKIDYNRFLKEKYGDISYSGGWFGCKSELPLADSSSHWMAERACEFLEEFCENGRPWHIWVDFQEPHLPCRPSEPFSDMYCPEDIEPWPGFGDTFENKPYCHKQQTLNWDTYNLSWEDFAPMVARYYGVISQLDDAIGKILHKLEELNQMEKTIIVFTSDHGDMCGSHNMLDKHYVLYDDVTRIPLMVHYPGISPAVCHSFVSNCLDLPASFAEWFELKSSYVLHGKSLPLTAEEDAAGRTDICSSSNGQAFGLFTNRMLRDKRYKYIWNLTDVDELYDLETDPGEIENLIAKEEHKERITCMRHLLIQRLKEIDDPYMRNELIVKQLFDEKKHLR